LPFGQLTEFGSATEAGELAIVGRWQESLALTIIAASPGFTIDLIYPDTTNGAFIRNTLSITGATAGTQVTLTVDRGNRALLVSGASATASVSTVAETPLTVVHASQDLNLDPTGHIVTVLFNRPVQVTDAGSLRDLVTLQTSVPSAGVTVTKKNAPLDPTKPIVIPGASIQDDNRLMNISFDHALSTNAQYHIGLAPFTDALVPGMTYASDPPAIVPRVDNNAPGGVVVGTVIKGDNTALQSAMVQLEGSGGQQFDFTAADGTFLFEFIHRDIDLGFPGTYSLSVADGDKRARLDGAIRTAGEVQKVVMQFLGRGSATGHAHYSDGTPIANAPVTVGSTLYDEWHRATTDANGLYAIADLPVGPLTFAVVDAKGNVSYAANQIRTPGEVVTQDLVIEKKEFAGLASVRVTVKRDDTNAVVAGAHVGVSTQGYGLVDGFTNSNGQFTFTNVPAGFVSVLASEFGIAPQSIGVDFDLKADTFVDQQLLLHIPAASDSIATVSGNVTRDDPSHPNLTTLVPVSGARVTIGHLAPVTADNNGHYVVTGVSTSLAGQKAAAAYDPATGRSAVATLPAQLHTDSENDLPIKMLTTVPQGTATLKVILNAA